MSIKPHTMIIHKNNLLRFSLVASYTFLLSLTLQSKLMAYTLEQSVKQVKQQTQGEIISASTVNNNNRTEHHIKVLTQQGKVKRFKFQQNSSSKKSRK